MPDSKRKSPDPTSYPRQRPRITGAPTATDDGPPSSAMQIQNLLNPPPLDLPYPTTNLPSISALPSAPHFLTIPNPLASTSLSHSSAIGAIAEASSLIQPGTVNVVGQNQFNVTTHIHVNPVEENVTRFGSVVEDSTEKYLLNPLLDRLSHVAKASYDASTPALRRACTQNTRTAILKAITDWAFDPTKANIYWMNGMAGTGKTTITYSLSIALKSHNTLMSTFFCSRLVDECTKVDRIFPTIAYNLARNYVPLASTILEVLKKDPDIANRTLNQQFTELLVKPTRVAAEKLAGKPIVIIVDALDECANQTEVQTLLSILFRRSSELSFKIFITSRPEQVVRVGFNRQNPDNYSKLILHDIDRGLVNEDIKLYLAERLVEMVEGRSDFEESSDDWPPADKVDILARQASGLFIYAKTVCDYIGVHGGNISENLNAASLPRKDSGELSGDTLDTSELDRLYRDILDRAVPSEPKARDRLRRVLSAIVNIRNPLSARGLGALLDMDPGVIKSALGSLHSVISVPKSLGAPVSTFHASFPDCLSESTRSLQHFLPPSQSHQMLAKNCLSLMNSSLKENICNLKGRPANDTIAKETISTHIPEGLAYACMYWAPHLIGTGKEEIQNADDVRQLLNEFLRDHVLHWMECLSLLRQLSVAVESLRAIERWILNIYSEMSSAVSDARRFVIENFEIVSGYCLETYHSALVWLPVQSTIRKHYTTQKPHVPKVTLGLRNTWGCCEKTMICGSEVNSVAFSSDGRYVVSGSQDKVVRIWNALTGEFEGAFMGHSAPVLAVAFSSDSRRVMSGSSDETVRIWDAATGESEGVFEGHLGGVTSVAFASDGIHVVSVPCDRAIWIWNTVTGELKNRFEGHSDDVLSVAFSSDGSRIVSGSVDMTIRIWNAETGQSEGVFEGHSDEVTSVAFSSDGSHVVSGSSDLTVCIWDASTGELEQVFEGHSADVSSVAFSSDGTYVVSGSFDETVRVWNVATGGSEGVFEGHSDLVLSVAFSSDGGLVVSGSSDLTVRIWNAATGESEGVFGGHSDGVLSVTFSNDGTHVVSGSSDKTIRVWNALTCVEEAFLEGHSGGVKSVAFSSDGSHVISGSFDNTVRIWDMVTGVTKYVLDRHSILSVSLPNQTQIRYEGSGNFAISRPGGHREFFPHTSHVFGLSKDKSWIRWAPQRSCWIPERYRGFTCTHSYGLKTVFGYRSGEVVMIDREPFI